MAETADPVFSTHGRGGFFLPQSFIQNLNTNDLIGSIPTSVLLCILKVCFLNCHMQVTDQALGFC